MEAAYPILLCKRLAAIAKIKAVELGATEVHHLAQQTELAPSSQHRSLLDMLPKGRKFKPLVSEYGLYEKWAVALQPQFSDQQFLQTFPNGTNFYIDSFTRARSGSMMVTVDSKTAETVTSNAMPLVSWSTLRTKF